MMDHPNIAKVLDAGATETGRPYFVMELVRGIKITDYADQHNSTRNSVWGFSFRSASRFSTRTKKESFHRDISHRTFWLPCMTGSQFPK